MKRLLVPLFCIAALAACGGGGDDDETVMVVAEDTVLAANPQTTAAVVNEPFVFSDGVAAFATTSETTVVFTDTATTPAFSITADGNTATGTTAFGSCIFRVESSSFPDGHPLANGQTVTVNPCSLSVSTAGATADGINMSRSVALVLGAASSAGASVTVGVTSSGGLVLNGSIVTTVVLTPVKVTGGGS